MTYRSIHHNINFLLENILRFCSVLRYSNKWQSINLCLSTFNNSRRFCIWTINISCYGTIEIQQTFRICSETSSVKIWN